VQAVDEHLVDQMTRMPGLWCLPAPAGHGHLTVDMTDPRGLVYGWWCLWCGTAAYDQERYEQETGNAC